VTPVLRAAVAADLPALAALTRITQREHAARQPDRFGAKDVPGAESWAVAVVRGKRRGVALVAEAGGEIVGHAGFALQDWPAPGGRHDLRATVYDISIDPAVRAHGVGRALLAELAGRAETLGVTEMRADVWAGNGPSAELFAEMGFVPQATDVGLRLAPSRHGPPPRPARWRALAVEVLRAGSLIAVGLILGLMAR